jgi:hypothetical protein
MTEAENGVDPEALPEKRDYLTIFLVSCAILGFQVALTRVLSVVVWYHFAFLTISMVMLGLGAPGVWFALMRRPLRLLPVCLLASGIAVPASVVFIVKLGAELVLENHDPLWIVICVLPAMLAVGSVICLLLMKATGETISRMYGIDLLGACLGAVVVIPLLHTVPTPQLAASCGILPLFALTLYGKPWRIPAWAAIGVIATTMAATDLLQVTRSKSYDERIAKPVYEKWTPTARLTIFDESFFYLADHEEGFAWGRGSKFPADRKIRQYWIEQDGSAGTPITRFDGDLSKVDYLFYDVTSVGYELRPPERVAIIGGGGGRDILSALLSGTRSIDAVELNRHTIETVTERFGHISGDIYNHPGVHAFANEGRSHLTHTDDQFDLIQISLTDTWAASAAGAFALAENNLYTLQSFDLYLERLDPKGLLSISRWLNEMPRLMILSRAALLDAGFENAEEHLLLIAAQEVGTLLVSKTPFEPRDVAKLDAVSRRRGFIIQYPVVRGHSGNPVVSDIIEGRLDSLAESGYNTEPPTDDSPYLFHIVSPFGNADLLGEDEFKLTTINVNWSSTIVLRKAMIVVSALAIVLFILPLVREGLRNRGSGGTTRQQWAELLRATLFFAAIGTSFMLLENMLIQHFVLYLGHPSYAVTVIIASLLMGMGVGSNFAVRVGVDGLARFGWLVPVVVLLIVLALPTLFSATLGMWLGLRIMASCVILLPLGAGLGLFFPLGMLRFGDANKPWFWAINGTFGVVASVMSLALSMEFGFLAVGKLAAVIYAIAWLCLRSSTSVEGLAPGASVR